jgi:gluconolactonase
MFEIDMRGAGSGRIIGDAPPLDVIHRGVVFGEGPVWDRRRKALFFTDIVGDTIWMWTPGMGAQVVLEPSGHANGMTLDRAGRLLVAGWGGRTVFRFEPDGSLATLAARYQGRKLNSPNDIVVRSDGSIYFTDPPGGLFNVGHTGDDMQRYLEIQGVYRIAPDGKEMTLVTADFVYPNGLCFSPDERLLYINCSRERLIRVYEVQADGGVRNGTVFFQYEGAERGNPDGIKCDVEGNVYCTGPGGIWVHDPQGRVVARLRIPHHPTNFAFGDDDWRSLYVTQLGWVMRTRVNIPGVASW